MKLTNAYFFAATRLTFSIAPSKINTEIQYKRKYFLITLKQYAKITKPHRKGHDTQRYRQSSLVLIDEETIWVCQDNQVMNCSSRRNITKIHASLHQNHQNYQTQYQYKKETKPLKDQVGKVGANQRTRHRYQYQLI